MMALRSLALACLLLAVSYLPGTQATCGINQLDGYFGTVANYQSRQYLNDNWAAVTGLYTTQCGLQDNCQQNCGSNVVLSISTEVNHNYFYVMINNFILQTDGSWATCNNINSCSALNTAMGITNTTIIPGSSYKYFAGYFNTPQNDSSYGRWVSTFPFDGQFSPVYQIPFNNWKCPITTTTNGHTTVTPASNTVLIFNKLNWRNYQCSSVYTFTITRTCTSNVRGDPQFNGLRGQDYQVHGIDGGIYSIISAPSYYVNSEFVWLDGPRECPVMPSTGKKSVACFAHKGSYLKNLALVGTDGTRVLIESGSASFGVASVTVNGKTLTVGDSLALSGSGEMVAYNTTHEVTVSIGAFAIEVENSDGFLNLRQVEVKQGEWAQLKADGVHGLLGQTWHKSSKLGAVIEGKVDDYLVESGDVFGTDTLYNRYSVIA